MSLVAARVRGVRVPNTYEVPDTDGADAGTDDADSDTDDDVVPCEGTVVLAKTHRCPCADTIVLAKTHRGASEDIVVHANDDDDASSAGSVPLPGSGVSNS